MTSRHDLRAFSILVIYCVLSMALAWLHTRKIIREVNEHRPPDQHFHMLDLDRGWHLGRVIDLMKEHQALKAGRRTVLVFTITQIAWGVMFYILALWLFLT